MHLLNLQKAVNRFALLRTEPKQRKMLWSHFQLLDKWSTLLWSHSLQKLPGQILFLAQTWPSRRWSGVRIAELLLLLRERGTEIPSTRSPLSHTGFPCPQTQLSLSTCHRPFSDSIRRLCSLGHDRQRQALFVSSEKVTFTWAWKKSASIPVLCKARPPRATQRQKRTDCCDLLDS